MTVFFIDLFSVSVFTRDTMDMEKQERVDGERKAYLKMMCGHLQGTAGPGGAPRMTARIHSCLVHLRQFAENIRHCEVNTVIL